MSRRLPLNFFAIKNYHVKTQKIRNLNIKSGIWRGLFVSFIIFCLFGAIVFIVWQGLIMTQGPNPELSSEGFYQFVLFTIMMGASVGSLPDLYANIQKTFGAIENLMGIINDSTEKDELKGELKEGIFGKISFNEVSFSYAQRADIPVLKGVSFEINKNAQVALVGSSGSGKTTIASLILNFYHVQKGEIRIDDNEIADYDLSYLRAQMAYVPQDVLLFSGSIYENIVFGNPNASKAEVESAAKKANAWEFISSFPDGLDTEVGDRGIQLSGGQKQRIAIARAILKNPTILILDEATSALDSESEKLVQDALEVLMKEEPPLLLLIDFQRLKRQTKYWFLIMVALQNLASIKSSWPKTESMQSSFTCNNLMLQNRKVLFFIPYIYVQLKIYEIYIYSHYCINFKLDLCSRGL